MTTQSNEEIIIDDVIHDLESLDFNCKEAREVVRNALHANRNALIEEIEKKDKYINAHVQFVTDVLDGMKPDVAYRTMMSYLESDNKETL